MPKVAFIQGGGVGFDQEASVRKIFAALRVPVEFETFACGRASLSQGQDAIAPATLEAVKKIGLGLKTKLLPPDDGRQASTNYNVAFRKFLGCFASVRPVRNLPGLPARFQGVNITLVRELTEDLYAASEHEVVPGVVQSFKVVTAAACLRFFKFVFQLAARQGRKTVHCIHKANILKMADGLFLECFRRTAKDFPDIEAKELIVDNACMQLVSRPGQFQMLAAGNLYGDLLSDLGAGLVGGISATAAINYGEGMTLYEAVYGAGYESVPAGKANPLPLLLPAVELLKDINEGGAAAQILRAIEAVLTEGRIKPSDLGGSAGTEEFTDALIARM